jgi:hypothetical protein
LAKLRARVLELDGTQLWLFIALFNGCFFPSNPLRRFPILKRAFFFHPVKQTLIIMACCALNNFIMDTAGDGDYFYVTYLDRERRGVLPDRHGDNGVAGQTVSDADRAAGHVLREHIADEMWREYQRRRFNHTEQIQP